MGIKEGVLLRAERRLMCAVKLKNTKKASELMSTLGLYDDIVTLVVTD